ncbi:MAG: DNA polymerase IV [Propionivibrio sp.]|uniref:DNA polymerase IV n=1 Tax=Propionivibrio sp. TaxID=2212460 RepID=UPI001A524CD6|nr:DNA polymerase IV [Propionivibrio sp.]MBL8412975.1 DNA polymerase IV [Propionivibrio sp.]
MFSIRRIAHLDMDAFFASVELLRYPELRGQAVVVGGRNVHHPVEQPDGTKRFARLRDYAGRGVITTSTYEARALGVFSGMGLMKSAQLAPEAILLPANFDAYRDYSRRFKNAVESIAPKIEDRGIDEIYIDLSAIQENTNSLARRIKQAVFDATGLTCSIGITPNKLLSKICSDLDKPNGITILSMEEIPARIWPLATKKINGIGPRAAEKLTRHGINTIGELAAAPVQFLVSEFGRSTGFWLHQVAHGLDDRPIVTESESKSISRESTFERDLHAKHNKAELTEILTSLCMRVAEDLKRKGYVSRTIGIKLKFSDFHAVTRDVTLPGYVSDGTQIRKMAGECLKRIPLTQKIRLLGVRASGLIPMAEAELNHAGIQSEFPF